jgi:hypothetical protein
MKFRAVTTTSERELILSLRSGGRHVSLAQLSDWRKEGLLPPLASRGLGPTKGRCYYWNEDNILNHARCVHDLLRRHHQHSIVILILWLCGHPVPLSKVRRAWLRHTRGSRSWPVRSVPPRGEAASSRPAYPELLESDRTDTVFLKTILKLSSSFAAGRRAESDDLYHTLHRASDALGYQSDAAGGIQYHLFIVLRLIIAAIESSSLLGEARDEDLEAARRITETATRLVQALIDEDRPETFEVRLSGRMEIVGEPFFLCALVLQRTGYRDHIASSEAAMRSLLSHVDGREAADRERFFEAFRHRLSGIWAAPAGDQTRQKAGEGAKSRQTGKMKASLAFCYAAVFAVELLSENLLAAMAAFAA